MKLKQRKTKRRKTKRRVLFVEEAAQVVGLAPVSIYRAVALRRKGIGTMLEHALMRKIKTVAHHSTLLTPAMPTKSQTFSKKQMVCAVLISFLEKIC